MNLNETHLKKSNATKQSIRCSNESSPTGNELIKKRKRKKEQNNKRKEKKGNSVKRATGNRKKKEEATAKKRPSPGCRGTWETEQLIDDVDTDDVDDDDVDVDDVGRRANPEQANSLARTKEKRRPCVARLLLRFAFVFFNYCIAVYFVNVDINISLALFLLGFTGFYWVLLDFTGFYWVLLGFTGFYWVLLGCFTC